MFGDETGGIVVDYGTRTTKFGFAGEDCPRLVLATKHAFAQQYHAGLSQLFPAERTDEGGEEKMDLVVESLSRKQDHPLMCIIPALLPLKDQISFTESILEDGHTPAMYMLRSPVASAFSVGKTSCVVVLDMGAKSATCSPVYQGYTLLKSTTASEACGGDALTQALLASCRSSSGAATSFELAEEIKRHAKLVDLSATAPIATDDTAVAQEEEYTLERRSKGTYTLPDGTPVEYNAALVQDTLFPALPDLVFDSVGKCDPDLRKMFMGELLVVGGGSHFKHLGDRLTRELGERLNPFFKPKVHASGTSIERHFAPFVGGSILACLGSFQQEWASKREVLELGAERICLDRFIH